MKKPINYSLTWIQGEEQKEKIFFSHQALLEEYLYILCNVRNISSLKAWKIYAKAPKEEYTVTLNKFIAYGK